MVSGVSILAMVVTLLLTLVMPIAAWIVYTVKYRDKKVGIAVLLGAVGFFVMQNIVNQTIIKLFLMRWLMNNTGYVNLYMEHYAVYGLIIASKAALVEVIARYVVAKILAKKLTFEHGIATGLGHGGIEAVTLVGITYINNLLYSVMINTGMYDVMLEQTDAITVYTSSLHRVKEQLIETAPSLYLLAGYERVLTMVLHIALSLLVCYFVKHKKGFLGVIICFLIHTFVDYSVLMINGMGLTFFEYEISYDTAQVLIYVFLTLVAVGSVFLIRKIKKNWR